MRLIDLDTLLQFLESQNCANDWLVSMYNADWIASWLESQPIIEVDVVRCKDCKHRGTLNCPMHFEEDVTYTDDDGNREWDWIPYDQTNDDGFCDRGERRDNT